MRIFALGIALLLFGSSNAQTPNRFSYQAVVRNAGNSLVVEKQISLRVSILKDSAVGVTIYSERHNPTTNTYGVINVSIGGGANTIGNFDRIEWGVGSFFLKTEIDPSNGNNFTIIGVTQLLSVPYSKYADNSGYRDYGNTAIGRNTLDSNTSGYSNTAFGYRALRSNSTGYYSTAIGNQALFSNTTGKDNEAIGNNALRDNKTGESNTAIGGNAMLENIDGIHNVAIGHAVNQRNKNGRYNTIVGSYSAENLLSGNRNTIVGFNSAQNWSDASANVIIGSQAGNNNVHRNVSNKLIISNSGITDPLIYGDFENRLIKFNYYIDSPIVYNILSFQDANANSHTNRYENNIGEPVIYARYLYGQYGDLVIQGLSKTYTGNIHFVTGSTVAGADAPTQRMVVMGNGKVGIGNFLNSAPRSRLEIRDGDVYLPSSNNGIILTSSNGSCWRVTVDDTGNLVRTKINCPTN